MHEVEVEYYSDTTMSILKYFKVKGAKEKSQNDLLELPDPSGSLSKEIPSSSIAAAIPWLNP